MSNPDYPAGPGQGAQNFDPNGYQQGQPGYGPTQPAYGQPQHGGQYGYVQHQPVNPEKNGFGLASLILAIVGLVFGIIPLTGFICLILGIIGLALGFAGLSRVRKNRATNKKTAISGIVVSVLAIALGIWGITIVFGAVDDLDSGLDCISNADTAAQMEACSE
ncbi:DUF4190 domain-containing protein [Rhodococcus sp. B10]|uniref:DUF4190 domain-containing protein n=1 Tax=Rhodococcus sp. B10 TaxID=2695876 RepID=UPI00142FD68B|nr:DUF4190 domain-containing protein [Rhodococcus sp. B10]NIL74918.1 hypothetical protein [Rhodococcus sp. B10]